VGVLAGAMVVVAGAVVVGAERVPPPPPPPVPVCASANSKAPATNAADNPDRMMNFLMSNLPVLQPVELEGGTVTPNS